MNLVQHTIVLSREREMSLMVDVMLILNRRKLTDLGIIKIKFCSFRE